MTELKTSEALDIVENHAKSLPESSEKSALLAAIERLKSKEPIYLEDVCEACGQPTKNFEIHPHCKEWWV